MPLPYAVAFAKTDIPVITRHFIADIQSIMCAQEGNYQSAWHWTRNCSTRSWKCRTSTRLDWILTGLGIGGLSSTDLKPWQSLILNRHRCCTETFTRKVIHLLRQEGERACCSVKYFSSCKQKKTEEVQNREPPYRYYRTKMIFTCPKCRLSL